MDNEGSTKARRLLLSGIGWVAAQQRLHGGGDPQRILETPLVGVILNGFTL